MKESTKPLKEVWKQMLILLLTGSVAFSFLVSLMFAMDGEWDWDMFLILLAGTFMVMGCYFLVESRMKSYAYRHQKAIEITLAVVLVIAFLLGIRFIPSTL